MTQDTNKQPEDRRNSPSTSTSQSSRSAPSQKPSSSPSKAKDDATCLPCEESRSLSSGTESESRRGEQDAEGRDEERQGAPGQQGRTGSTYGGEQAKNEMEAEGGAAGRSEERGNASNRSGRPERPSR